ncbi:pectin lyase fold/virulence factor [Aspergillus cavernicola]|uniref:pectin lyase n=1 Tax=Aspergillus cavernicola TaxID=176166 RepID=A0ABR4HQB8_9EURO
MKKTTLSSLLTLLLSTAPTTTAQVTGSPSGFAAGTTGGGNATPQTPSSLAELVTWITDSTPRTILIDREWNFIGTEGTTSSQCCSNQITVCAGGTSAGQAWIGDTCDDGTWISCTYDNAGQSPLDVGSDKSIVGVGSAGVLRGKGLRVRGGNRNVIIQNIHVTELNPRYVWGGDAITLDGSDMVWIDHCKFSLAGRQFIVSGWGAAGRVTISNNEFDGVTSWSAGCNGRHYWTLLLIGEEDWYTFQGNWVHDVSGRAPHLGTDYTDSRILFHGVNNYFQDVGGHAFDVDTNTWVLLEGNYFDGVDTPVTGGTLSSGALVYNVPTVDSASACVSSLGYICEWNRLAASGSWPSLAQQAVLDTFSEYTDSLVDAYGVADVPATVVANAGVGKI